MESLGLGQVLLLIAFMLLPLFKSFLQRVRRAAESARPADEPATDTLARAQTTPKSAPPTSRVSRNKVHASQAPTVATPLSGGRFSKRSLLGNTRDVRRGIILMTILGPCRASDSPESRPYGKNLEQTGKD
jgi:hypothetical protein